MNDSTNMQSQSSLPGQKTIICAYCNKIIPRNESVREHLVPRYLPGGRVRTTTLPACRECSLERAKDQYAEYLAYRISQNKNTYESFLTSLYEIETVLKVKMPDGQLEGSLARMLFVSVVTTMETYLSDVYINTVLNDDSLLRRLVETNPDLKDRKLALGEIFPRIAGLKEEIRNYLLEVIYHNLAKVKPMYETVLGVQFPKNMEGLFTAVQKRHDIVHRGGKSKTGIAVVVSMRDVYELIKEVKAFIVNLDKQVGALRRTAEPNGAV